MIVPLTPDRLDDLLALWKQYQVFYKVASIDEDRNRAFVTHILNNPDQGKIHLAMEENEVVGFSTLYFTYASTVAARVTVLNDLFVSDRHRRKGIARTLLDHAQVVTRDEGIAYMRWMTQESNTQAQALYKDFANPSHWQLYVVNTEAS